MGGSSVGGDGSLDYRGGLILGNDQGKHPLTRHQAVGSHGNGTSTPELADFIRVLTEAAVERVSTIGDDQYNTGGLQKFETMSTDDVVQALLEEIYDCQSYLAMLAIKVIALGERAR